MNTSGSNRESGRGLRLICQASAIFFLQFATSGASAQDWTFIPQLGAGAEADDNASLSTRTDEEVDLNGWLGDARLEVAYTSPGTVFSIEPRLRWLRYPDNEEFDSDDQFADLFFTHQGRYNRFRVTGGYARESIRTGERDDVDLNVEDPDDNTDNNTGIVQEGRRERVRVRPTWEYRFSEFCSAGWTTTRTRG